MNCYGAWAPELRHPIETVGYNQYLNVFVGAVFVLKDQIEAVYISGGMYDSLDRTECETVKPELLRRFEEKNIPFSIQTDEESITSTMIMKKFLETWKNEYAKCTPIIFVDEVRYEINKFTFEYYCKEFGIDGLKSRDAVAPIARLDIHPRSTVEKQAEKLALMKKKGVEYVENIELEVRKKHLKKK